MGLQTEIVLSMMGGPYRDPIVKQTDSKERVCGIAASHGPCVGPIRAERAINTRSGVRMVEPYSISMIDTTIK